MQNPCYATVQDSELSLLASTLEDTRADRRRGRKPDRPRIV